MQVLGLVCPIQATKNMHNMSPKCLCNHPSFFEKEMDLIIHRQEKQEAGNTFVLPAVTTMCTYNVEGSQICNYLLTQITFNISFLWKLAACKINGSFSCSNE
jgi:hypothetical protein